MAIDRIQPLKIEDTATGEEVDQYPTALDKNEDFIDCHGIALQSTVSDDENVLVGRDDSGNMTLKDVVAGSFTLSALSAGGSGITEAQHALLDTLVHDIDETSWDELIYVAGRVDSVITWETSSKLKKVREMTITYTSGKPTKVVTKQYDSAGVLKETLTEDIVYSGSNVSDITRVKS